MTEEKRQFHPGVGIDIGTMNLVSARQTADGKTVTNRVRDAFIDLDPEVKKSLRMSKVSYVEKGGQLIVIGDSALTMANLFKREVRRPLARGVISAAEIDAQEILSLLVHNVLGDPVVKGEHCFYSVPAGPVDDPDQDVVYHREVFRKILCEHGYTPHPMNEAMAIVYSQCAEDGFSGLGISFGCLTPDTSIFTRRGYTPIRDVREGDEVITRTGRYGRVLKTWERDHSGEVYKLSFYGNPEGVTLTGNHKVWVQRRDAWEWVQAEHLEKGDIIGEAIVSGYGSTKHLCLTDKDRNGPSKSLTIPWSLQLGRFLGYFLADGHLGPEEDGSIWFDFGPNEQAYADDVKELAAQYFDRAVTFHPHGEAIRCQMQHTGLKKWLRNNCYEKTAPDAKATKKFPLNIDDMAPGVVEGVVVGLVRGDGWISDSQVKFGNSSTSLITAFHLLVGRMGLTSTITTRESRGATFKDGREILPENCKDEWTVHITGWDGKYLESIVEDFTREKLAPKIWRDGGFRCTRIRSIEVLPYEGKVHDLTVEGDPSFCAPFITLHNSGMCNVALAYQTVEGMSFSVARGGDWIDTHAAKAVGSTASRMCAIKEKGIDLMKPEGREQEAIALYIRSLVSYCLDNIAVQFKQVQSSIDLPDAVPFIVSGGTTRAGGFMGTFKEEFETAVKKRGFPIKVSEIRQARDPMTAVAEGLLVLSNEEHADT